MDIGLVKIKTRKQNFVASNACKKMNKLFTKSTTTGILTKVF